MIEELLVRIVEQAPTIAVLLYLVYRQDQRLAELEQVLVELLHALRAPH